MQAGIASLRGYQSGGPVSPPPRGRSWFQELKKQFLDDTELGIHYTDRNRPRSWTDLRMRENFPLSMVRHTGAMGKAALGGIGSLLKKINPLSWLSQKDPRTGMVRGSDEWMRARADPRLGSQAETGAAVTRYLAEPSSGYRHGQVVPPPGWPPGTETWAEPLHHVTPWTPDPLGIVDTGSPSTGLNPKSAVSIENELLDEFRHILEGDAFNRNQTPYGRNWPKDLQLGSQAETGAAVTRSVTDSWSDIFTEKISTQEIALAIDDPMFGSGNWDASMKHGFLESALDPDDPDHNEIRRRVYARRYVNARLGLVGLDERQRRMPYPASPRFDPEDFEKVEPRRRGLGLAGLHGPQSPRDAVRATVRSYPRSALANETPDFIEQASSARGELAERGGTRSNPLSKFWGGLDRRQSPRGRVRRAIADPKRAGVAALRAISGKLPAALMASAAAAATSHPLSALADIAMAPTDLGSGDLPIGESEEVGRLGAIELLSGNIEDPSLISRKANGRERESKYYDDLLRQADLLEEEVGLSSLRDRLPSDFVTRRLRSSPITRPEITSSSFYPGQQLRNRSLRQYSRRR